MDGGESVWRDACLAAALLAIDRAGLGGLQLRARPGAVRDAWMDYTRSLFDADSAWRKIPQSVSEARLLGGLDLAATLKHGAPIAQQGLLAECDGGVALLAMAERTERNIVSHLCQALNRGIVDVQRENVSEQREARFALLALDEGADDDEALEPALAERLAFHIDLHGVGIRDLAEEAFGIQDIQAARQSLNRVVTRDDDIERLCGAALGMGIESPRAVMFALRAARAVAAATGKHRIDDSCLEDALRLVLLPRATRLPAPETDEPETQEPPPPETDQDSQDGSDKQQAERMEDRLIEAAMAALPEDLLARLTKGALARQAGRGGKSGELRRSKLRGRPMGTVAGDPRTGARLSPVATLRAAAPWQPVRRGRSGSGTAMLVEPDDFRVVRYRERNESTTIFVVDASGSAALNRLAEAKGAVELLLADCYVRRDQVAMVAFRGEIAEVLLPPTRSLVRAKRNLAALPGGGGTPLASAVETAALMVDQLRRRGSTPNVVFLTDGRGNIGRDGSRGREAAADDLEAATALFRACGASGMVIDTSPRPSRQAEVLASRMALQYLPLPHADASQLRDAVSGASR